MEKLNRVRRIARALALLLAMWALPLPAGAALPDPVRFGIAVERGDLGSVKEWLEAGLDPDFMADRVGSGLMIAAWEGNLPMMELFLSHGARIELVNRHDEQALQLAAWKGNLEAVKWLLAHGANPNRAGAHWSALHYAAFADRREVARLLIASGGELNVRAPNGSTALMMTAREGRDELARLLIDAGADPTLANDSGDSALTWAMRHGNFGIARMVGNAAEFARAAKAAPESFGKPLRSQPAPPEIEEILRQIRLAQAAGKPADALRKKLFDAVARFKKDSQVVVIAKQDKPRSGKIAQSGQRGKPKALLITARRGSGKQADGERAELVYETQTKIPMQTAKGALPPVADGGEVPVILERIARARAAGKPEDDLRKALFEAIARFKREESAEPAAAGK